jgi:hypothetical protein
VVLLASDAVESLSESADARKAVSVAGVVSPKVLVSKTIVTGKSVEALAEVGIAVRPARANRPVRTTAVVLFVSDIIFELRTVVMGFPFNDSFSCF